MKNLYIFTESASPAGLAAVLNRLRSTEPTGYGVHYFRIKGHLMPLTGQLLFESKVTLEGFIIGVEINKLIHPIYDINRQAVVIRVSDMMNIPIGAFDALELPFYKELPKNYLPRNLQHGEGSSRGNN